MLSTEYLKHIQLACYLWVHTMSDPISLMFSFPRFCKRGAAIWLFSVRLEIPKSICSTDKLSTKAACCQSPEHLASGIYGNLNSWSFVGLDDFTHAQTQNESALFYQIIYPSFIFFLVSKTLLLSLVFCCMLSYVSCPYQLM